MHAGLIALTDCNCFYVSAHRLFEPQLIGKPVVALSNGDGNVVSRSNEAKALGIKMAQPWFELKNLVRRHGLVGRSSQYCLYGEVSNRVLDVMRTFSPVIEPYSIYAGSFWSSFFGVRKGRVKGRRGSRSGAQPCLQGEHRTGEHRAHAHPLPAW